MTDTPPDDPTPEAPDADAAATVDAGERTDVESAATTAVAEPAPAAVDERPRDALQTRLLIPLLLPVLAVIAVGIYALNVSRVFLAQTPGIEEPDLTAEVLAANIDRVDDPTGYVIKGGPSA